MQGFTGPPSAGDVAWDEPHCTFSAFVAEHRGIGMHEAEQLIEHWLETYEPITRPAPFLPTETDDDRDPSYLRICA
jgi:hypothetical protein